MGKFLAAIMSAVFFAVVFAVVATPGISVISALLMFAWNYAFVAIVPGLKPITWFVACWLYTGLLVLSMPFSNIPACYAKSRNDR